MQIPALEDFRQPSGTAYGPPWEVDPKGADFTLTIPDGDREWEPHEPSYRLALRVLPEIGWLAARAVEYLSGIVDPAKVGMAGEPYLVHLHCDARSERVTVEMAWETDVYSAWSVTFSWCEREPPVGRSCWPVAMGLRSR